MSVFMAGNIYVGVVGAKALKRDVYGRNQVSKKKPRYLSMGMYR